MTKTSSRCDRIIALIDACLADVEGSAVSTGSVGSAGRPGSTGSPAAYSPRFVPSSLTSLV